MHFFIILLIAKGALQLLQFLAWDTFARRRVDLIGRKDRGDEIIAHEFDYTIRNQVCSSTSTLPFNRQKQALVIRDF